MVSFQCSPLATSEGIIGTFRQCSKFQKDKDLDKFVSAVVLDEVGLAEDSPKMPLKVLFKLNIRLVSLRNRVVCVYAIVCVRVYESMCAIKTCFRLF